MTLQNFISLIFVTTFFKLVEAPQPGTFFWKPRLGLDLSVPTTDNSDKVPFPSKESIESGKVVLIKGYKAGMTLIAVCAAVGGGAHMLYLNPLKAYYYTDVWRWFLRYLSLIPEWLSGTEGNFRETYKLWKHRFQFTEEFIPKWISNMLFFVDKSSWKQELKDFRNFKIHSLPTFSKHFRNPNEKANNNILEISKESEDTLLRSSLSEDA